MSLTSATAISPSSAQGRAAARSLDAATLRVRVSSRALGWVGLNFERRDHQPSSRTLVHGSRDHLVFVCLAAGRIVRTSANERVAHELVPGCVGVVPARVPVGWTWSTPISFSVLRLDPDFLDRVAQSVFGVEPDGYHLSLVERPHDTAIANIAGVLAREVMHGERGSALYAEALANILAVHLLRQYARCAGGGPLADCAAPASGASVSADVGSPRPTRPRAVSEALTFIHANYARDLTLVEIAQAAHLSPYHLARLFKQSLGVSPHRYLIQLRVSTARWLLSAGSGERSLAQVATAVGFSDQSHLTRHFKRLTGVTPRQFRP